MKVNYFKDTDTAFVEFSNNEIEETIEISESVYIDIDSGGDLVSMTIEHAKESGALTTFSYEEIATQTA